MGLCKKNCQRQRQHANAKTAQARQERSCRRKVTHTTEAGARGHAAAVSTALRRLSPYACPVCGLWHVGTLAPTPPTHRR